MRLPPTIIRDKETNFQAKKCYWSTFNGPDLFGNYHVLDKLGSVNPTEISKNVIIRLEKIFKDNDLSEERVRTASRAAKGLFKWVNAIRTYYFVY